LPDSVRDLVHDSVHGLVRDLEPDLVHEILPVLKEKRDAYCFEKEL